MTQNICSLVELGKGAALIIDYGSDHAFSNSFRVSCFIFGNLILFRE